MFAVGWMELKDARRAWDLLDRSFANITEPFKASLDPASPSLGHTPCAARVVGVGAQLLGSLRWPCPTDLPGAGTAAWGGLCPASRL